MYKIYNTTIGLNKIYDPFLAFINIKAIMREGTEYDIVYSTPNSRQAYHKTNTGEIIFNSTFSAGEKIFVLI